MNKWWLRSVLLTFLLVLTACGGRDGGLCSQASAGSLAPTCSPPPPEPPISPVGSWQGTLTTITGGLGTQPFTAEITEVDAEDADYAGVFTVSDEVYDVTGRFNGSNQDGEYFVFESPLSELQPTVSPVTPLGFTWSGTMTESTYQGGWFIFRGDEEDGNPSQEGTFSLERTP